MRPLIVLYSGFVIGCGSDESEPIVEPPIACAAGEWQREDGSCVPAGLPPDLPCTPGEWLREQDGACVPAGVPPNGCGSGFSHDGDRGCQAILPATPCGRGRLAVPGDGACHALSSCGSGPWGDIVIGPDTEHVDGNYALADSDGSAVKPWKTIQEAVDAAADGATVAIASGSYAEDVIVAGKRVTLEGRCADDVAIIGTTTALALRSGTDGSVVRAIALTGAGAGLALSNAADVTLEALWIHDNGLFGMIVESMPAATGFQAADVLVEQNVKIGVVVVGANATFERSAIVRTVPAPEGFGFGMLVRESPSARSTLLLRRSLLDRNEDHGIAAGASDITIEDTVIRDTRPTAQDVWGRGITVQTNPEPSVLQLRRSIVSGCSEAGVAVIGSQATVEDSVIRDTHSGHPSVSQGNGITSQGDARVGLGASMTARRSLFDANHSAAIVGLGSIVAVEGTAIRDTQPLNGQEYGRGISVSADPITQAPSTLTVSDAWLEHNHEIGIFVAASSAVVERTAVLGTYPNGLGAGGRALQVETNPETGAAADLFVSACRLEGNAEVSVGAKGAHATVESTWVVDSLLNGDGLGGRGFDASYEQRSGRPAVLDARGVLIERSAHIGMFVSGATATVTGCAVRDTLDAQGLGGDAFFVWTEVVETSLDLTATRVEGARRGALVVLGARVSYGGNVFECSAFDLVGDAFAGRTYEVHNLGGNFCGCPVPDGSCVLESASIAPPAQL